MFVVFLDRPLTNTPLEPLGTIAPLMAFFLWEKKKKKRGDGKKEEDDDNNTTKRAGEERKQKPKRSVEQTCVWTRWLVFSLSLSLLVSVSLSLGLIRLLVEMKAMGEDSGASDESVCVVIALIKRAV